MAKAVYSMVQGTVVMTWGQRAGIVTTAVEGYERVVAEVSQAMALALVHGLQALVDYQTDTHSPNLTLQVLGAQPRQTGGYETRRLWRYPLGLWELTGVVAVGVHHAGV
jgi:hypothetical protein